MARVKWHKSKLRGTYVSYSSVGQLWMALFRETAELDGWRLDVWPDGKAWRWVVRGGDGNAVASGFEAKRRHAKRAAEGFARANNKEDK